ncbi:MAG: GGDEF domain-containing protein [Xanthomonadaceae bacterium]|nr:GGDEF domain-containing protein [Xanthomonadaceae bacterium]
MLTAGLILGIPLGGVGASREGRAMRIWLGALTVQAMFWLLFLFGRDFHPLLSIVAVNTLSYLAMVEYFRAIREFLGRPHYRIAMYVTVLAVAALNVWFGILSPNFSIRVASVSIPGALLMLWLIATLTRHNEPGIMRPARVTALFFLVTAATLLMRWIDVLVDPQQSILSSTPQQLALMIYGFFPIFCSIGFLLMQTARAIRRLETLASVDDLTGAFNRRAFHKMAAHTLANCRRTDRPAALLLLDLDHFKQINDRHGHEAGDRVLVEFCRMLRQVVRDEDIIGRLGGEEFAILTPGANCDNAMLPAWDGQSRGIDTLLHDADNQLYRAKDAGRNRIAPASRDCGGSAA